MRFLLTNHVRPRILSGQRTNWAGAPHRGLVGLGLAGAGFTPRGVLLDESVFAQLLEKVLDIRMRACFVDVEPLACATNKLGIIKRVLSFDLFPKNGGASIQVVVEERLEIQQDGATVFERREYSRGSLADVHHTKR
ncbi:MAG TPA: hypothetical protein VKM94_22940 [Blastocatellia bacterium]|nr:hypothetical protein [Blastocatellia bacterium]